MNSLIQGVLHAATHEAAKLLVAAFWLVAAKWAKLGLHVVGGKLGDLSAYWMRTMNWQPKAC